jgi:hypothetical protein
MTAKGPGLWGLKRMKPGPCQSLNRTAGRFDHGWSPNASPEPGRRPKRWTAIHDRTAESRGYASSAGKCRAASPVKVVISWRTQPLRPAEKSVADPEHSDEG